jgi:hypothetical protein
MLRRLRTRDPRPTLEMDRRLSPGFRRETVSGNAYGEVQQPSALGRSSYLLPRGQESPCWLGRDELLARSKSPGHYGGRTTNRQHGPKREVDAYGRRDAQTLHSCYQLATTDGMLAVMSTPVKLRDRKVGSK